MSKRLGSKKHIWGFDSFEGFPRFSKQDNLNNFTEENGFGKEQIDDVHLLAKIRQTKNIKKVSSDFKSSLNELADEAEIKEIANSVKEVKKIKDGINIKKNFENEINTVKETVKIAENEISDIDKKN